MSFLLSELADQLAGEANAMDQAEGDSFDMDKDALKSADEAEEADDHDGAEEDFA